MENRGSSVLLEGPVEVDFVYYKNDGSIIIYGKVYIRFVSSPTVSDKRAYTVRLWFLGKTYPEPFFSNLENAGSPNAIF